MDPFDYKTVPINTTQIRVLRLPPSNFLHIKPLLCKLEAIEPSKCLYEALSYRWVNTEEHVNIQPNEKLFSISPDLHQALLTLCLPGVSRTLWIDAISINQRDDDEKSVQVSTMRSIYKSAQRTLVWLGAAKDGTEIAFQRTRELFRAASPEERQSIWSKGGPWVECLNEIIQRPYWTRAWTVQEVVVSKDSIIYCGAFTIPFFELATVLVFEDTMKHLNVTYSIYSYLNTVIAMRSEAWRDPELGLFALAYKFRHRQLSQRLDRVYAFRGLLQSPEFLQGNATNVDYKQKEGDLWLRLSKETMSKHQTLLPLAIVEENRHEDADWCLNFSQDFLEPNHFSEGKMLFWSGGLDDPHYFPLQTNSFSAAAGLKARVKVDLEIPSIISVQGFIADEIVAVGKKVNSVLIGFGRPNYIKIFSDWESLVGGPWDEDLKMTELFALTVTGGVWAKEPLNWRHWNRRNYAQRPWSWHQWRDSLKDTDEKSLGYLENRRGDSSGQPADYERVRDDACEGRRMVLLKSGKFGLTSEYAKVGDKLVVLLGCDVPMVLHVRDWTKWHKRFVDNEGKAKLYGQTWGIRGQAYVHDIMHYQGDLEHDIAGGKVSLETFLIDGDSTQLDNVL